MAGKTNCLRVELVKIFNTSIIKKHEEKLVVIYLGIINGPTNGVFAN